MLIFILRSLIDNIWGLNKILQLISFVPFSLFQMWLIEVLKLRIICSSHNTLKKFLSILGFEVRASCLLGTLPLEPCLQPFLLWLFWR
jgi:hypothetical protein